MDHKKKRQRSIFTIILLCIAAYTSFAKPINWQPLARGLEYALLRPELKSPVGKLHVFRLDLQFYQLDLALNDVTQMKSVQDIVLEHRALLGINGGFFSIAKEPLGLRIKNRQQINPMRAISWWGIFLIEKNQAKILAQKNYIPNSQTIFAVQSGPRLIINGLIPALKDGIANRTALGITRNGKVILLVTENLPLTTTELATIMEAPERKGGLNCVDALNLDGGKSTQIFARIKDFILAVPSFTSVADAILVLPKK